MTRGDGEKNICEGDRERKKREREWKLLCAYRERERGGKGGGGRNLFCDFDFHFLQEKFGCTWCTICLYHFVLYIRAQLALSRVIEKNIKKFSIEY